MNRWLKKHPMTTWRWHNWLAYFCINAMIGVGSFYFSGSLSGRPRSFSDMALMGLICGSGITTMMFLVTRMMFLVTRNAKKP